MNVFTKIIAIPAISANGLKQYLFNSKELKAGIRKHGYYSGITVTNGGEVDVRLELYGGAKSYPIPEGGLVELMNQRYEDFSIVNVNASYSTTAGAIEVICTAGGGVI